MKEHFFIEKSADSAEVGYGDSAEKGYGNSAEKEYGNSTNKGYKAWVILVMKVILNYYKFFIFLEYFQL